MKRRIVLMGFAIPIICSLFVAVPNHGAAQGTKLAKKVYIQATAMGTLTQQGKTFNVTAIIEELSAPEDQKVLLEAFQSKGNEGLVNALSKMPSKGRLAITGTLGGDLAYIRKFDLPDGSVRYRMVTNRLLRFGEAWSDSRSTDYQLSGMDVILSKDKKQNKGTLIPAAQLKVDKAGHLEIETYQNPWNLVNIQLR